MNTNRLSSSLEKYLETIFDIISKKKAANRMNVAGSSVTGALRSLKEKGQVNYEPYDIITLTTAGEKVARQVILRRDTMVKFFTAGLFLDEDTAMDAANEMKHIGSPLLVERMLQFLKFIGTYPEHRPIWTSDRGFVPRIDLNK